MLLYSINSPSKVYNDGVISSSAIYPSKSDFDYKWIVAEFGGNIQCEGRLSKCATYLSNNGYAHFPIIGAIRYGKNKVITGFGGFAISDTSAEAGDYGVAITPNNGRSKVGSGRISEIDVLWEDYTQLTPIRKSLAISGNFGQSISGDLGTSITGNSGLAVIGLGGICYAGENSIVQVLNSKEPGRSRSYMVNGTPGNLKPLTYYKDINDKMVETYSAQHTQIEFENIKNIYLKANEY